MPLPGDWMMEGSPQYHLLNGPTRADVGKSEGGSKQIASPRQTQGRCGELMNIFLRGKKQSRQSRALRQEVAMKFKVTMNLFVEPLSARRHNITRSLPQSASSDMWGQTFLLSCLPQAENGAEQMLSSTIHRQGWQQSGGHFLPPCK